MKITFKIHFLFFISAFICFITGLFKNFIMISSIILVHELGHILMAFILKWKIEKVIIFPFGGLTIFNQKINSSLKEEFFIALLGPILQIFFFTLLNTQNKTFITYHNLILLFNLMPIYPLDGSKILNIFLNKIFSFRKSYIITLVISIFILLFSTIIILNFDFNLILLLSICLLVTKILKYYNEFEYAFNKFLFERYLYKIKYRKIKNINGLNLNKMFKEKTHIFITNKSIIKEEEILFKMFDTH